MSEGSIIKSTKDWYTLSVTQEDSMALSRVASWELKVGSIACFHSFANPQKGSI